MAEDKTLMVAKVCFNMTGRSDAFDLLLALGKDTLEKIFVEENKNKKSKSNICIFSKTIVSHTWPSQLY